MELINELQKELYSNNLYSVGFLSYHYKKVISGKTTMNIFIFVYCILSLFSNQLIITKFLIILPTMILTIIIIKILEMYCKYIEINKYIIELPIKNTKIRLVKLNNAIDNELIIKDKIYYKSGKIFFDGLLNNNTIKKGKFYDEDGKLIIQIL
ncbi:hypothetical protein Hokovirus_1_17 [Hokovirus HKV1]|uniref:Uncharacterized protein n=1 Tax=Hokovirus HKV1 TaxID=1977638 RepID=A0A1V0SES4_9VIRU|nr:hypothetical protein Hokovirus_1_17 [Hokovirus HKV1]